MKRDTASMHEKIHLNSTHGMPCASAKKYLTMSNKKGGGGRGEGGEGRGERGEGRGSKKDI